MSEQVHVTSELIQAGMSGHGGWNKKQLAILGIEWPPTQGWKKRAIGKAISEEDAKQFVALKRKPSALDETKAATLARLHKLKDTVDEEAAHTEADDLLCNLLSHLGHGDVVAAFRAVPKWYS